MAASKVETRPAWPALPPGPSSGPAMPRPTRRHALTAIAGAAPMPRALVAQSAELLLPGTESCALTPKVTVGPYYLDPEPGQDADPD